MLTTRVLSGVLVAGAVAVASVFAAAPASAATLPSGQRITVLHYPDAAQFYDANPVDATLTAVGSPNLVPQSNFTALDVDDDGLGYAIGNYSVDFEIATLYDADANTGVLSNPRQLFFDFPLDVKIPVSLCGGIDYTAGIIMAICYEDFEGTLNPYWGIIDPDAAPGEAWLTPLTEMLDPDYAFGALAVDPVSGIVYAVGYNPQVGNELFRLSQDEGATLVTPMAQFAFELDFDRGGQAWVTSLVTVTIDEEPYNAAALATLSLTDGSNPFIEIMDIAGDVLAAPDVQPITVWGHEALPATGASNAPALGAVAAAVLLLGALLAAGTMRRGRTAEG